VNKTGPLLAAKGRLSLNAHSPHCIKNLAVVGKGKAKVLHPGEPSSSPCKPRSITRPAISLRRAAKACPCRVQVNIDAGCKGGPLSLKQYAGEAVPEAMSTTAKAEVAPLSKALKYLLGKEGYVRKTTPPVGGGAGKDSGWVAVEGKGTAKRLLVAEGLLGVGPYYKVDVVSHDGVGKEGEVKEGNDAAKKAKEVFFF